MSEQIVACIKDHLWAGSYTAVCPVAGCGKASYVTRTNTLVPHNATDLVVQLLEATQLELKPGCEHVTRLVVPKPHQPVQVCVSLPAKGGADDRS